MFIALMLSWWYGRGWFWLAGNIKGRLEAINETFSVPTLLKTLFAPWKQIQSPKSFKNFIQSSLDNFISRFIGATVRTGMLIFALLASTTVLLVGVAALIIWPFVPLLVVLAPIISMKVGGL